jgi:Deoxyribodipyrimidine photo-lyase-related protein
MAHIRVAPSAAFCVPRLSTRPEQPVRTLAIVFGDQLNRDSCVFDGFDAALDAVFMAEVREESEYVWSTKSRVALFLTAMRHFAQSTACRRSSRLLQPAR